MLRNVAGALLALGLLAASPAPGLAQNEKPFNLALFNPIQIYDETTPITAFRLNVLYGKNATTSGIDIGVVSLTTGGFMGFQWNLVGSVEGGFVGWQNNEIVNNVMGEARGVQTAFFNRADKMVGVQIGFINTSEDMHGFQLAIINYTQNLRGLQVGVVCVANQVKGHPVLPVVNWSF